jgi:hypothetical protein
MNTIELYEDKGDASVRQVVGSRKSVTFTTSRFDALTFMLENEKGVDVIYYGIDKTLVAFCSPTHGDSNGYLLLKSSGPVREKV